jgi:DNA primase
MTDTIIDLFVQKYGIKSLLEDLDVKQLQPSTNDNWVMCCPFHDESNASFSISIKNGLWKCFACGIEGNLYQFVSKSYNISYSEAKQFILARAGLDANVNFEDIIFLNDIGTILSTPANSLEEVALPTFDDYHINLMYETPDPYNYLVNRGFSEPVITYFQCGYTSQWRATSYATGKIGYEHRITIPGHDAYGSRAGFIGRTPINEEPKYRYTYAYPKSHTLFNLHRAKHWAHSNGLIVVEGSLDVMRIHQLGWPNVVAILGAKISEAQKRLLEKYTDRVYLMTDNDKAGQIALKHGIEILKDSLDVYVIPLGEYKDPGEIMESKIFKEMMDRSCSWFSYNLREGGK